MSDLDALLARSRDPGEMVERRSFTLSRDKALEKMRQFTLRHPGQYALEIVQAAVFLRARWMFVDADQYGVTMGWIGGGALTRAQLEGLFDYLFVSESVAEHRHLRQIAIAMNVLLQRKPHVLRIESGDALNGSARLDLDSDGSGTVGIPKDPLEGTYIHVQFQEKGWASMFTSRKAPPAADLIETECMFSPVGIFLNGDGPFGWDPYMPLRSLYVSRQKVFKGDGRDGWIGIGPPNETNRVTLVIGGVRISQREVPELGYNIRGVIRDDQLVKTADMSDVVDDANWRRLLHALQPIAKELFPDGTAFPDLPPIEEPEPTDTPEDPVEAAGVDVELVEPPSLDVGVRTLAGFRLDPAALHAIPADEHCYWVIPAHVRDVEHALDPMRFPGRVFILHPEQAEELVDDVPTLKLHRLLPRDVDFVVEQAKKKRSLERFKIQRSDGVLWLQLHLDGRAPGWRRDDRLPILVAHEGRTEAVFSAPVSLPAVSACFEADRYADDQRKVLARKVATSMHRHVWRLIPADPADIGPAHRALALAVLSEVVEILPTEDTGPEIRLPARWDEEAARILDTPLVESGITARQLLDVMGTDQVIEVASLDEIAALAPFTERIGVGHLVHPAFAGLGLLEMRWDGSRWAPADTPDPGPGCLGLVRLAPTFAPRPPDGFDRHPAPHPVLLAAQRDGADVPWAEGWRALATALHGGVSEDLPFSSSAARRADLVRLAVFALSDLVLPRVLYAASGRPVTLPEVQSGQVRLAYRGGPELLEDDTILVTADEAVVLSRGGHALRWRFDDAPSVWTQSPSDEAAWLTTVDVVSDAGRGWLGLRFPYDPTGSVFLRRGWRTHAASEIDHHLRCHGFIHARREHSHDGLDGLHGSAVELLDSLNDLLAGSLDPERRAAAERYAADFAWMGRQRGSPISRELADSLAASVEIVDPQGEHWGNMHLWLGTAAALRPPFPFAVHGFSGQPVDFALERDVGTALSTDTRVAAEDIISHAILRLGLGVQVDVVTEYRSSRISAWGTGRLQVELGLQDTLVSAAMAGDRRALKRVLFRIARAIHAVEAGEARGMDFVAMQKSVLATLAALD